MVLIHTLSRVLLLVMSEDILALRAVVPSPDKVSASCAGLSSYLLLVSPVSVNKNWSKKGFCITFAFHEIKPVFTAFISS